MTAIIKIAAHNPALKLTNLYPTNPDKAKPISGLNA